MRRFFADPVTGRYGYRRGPDAHADEGGDAQPPDGDLAVPGRGHRIGRRDPRRGRDRPRRRSRRPGLCGFSVSNLRIPGFERPWEGPESKPDRIASPLAIMIEGPIGAASFNNEFGRPNLAGYFRTYEQEVGGRPARLPQADHAGRRRRQHPRRARAQGGRAGRRRCSSSSAGRACSSAWAAAPPRRWRPARTRPTSTSTRCSAATRRSSGARRR